MIIKAHKNPLSLSISVPYKDLPFSAKIDAYRSLYQQRSLQAERFTKNLLNQKDPNIFRRNLVQSMLWNG